MRKLIRLVTGEKSQKKAMPFIRPVQWKRVKGSSSKSSQTILIKLLGSTGFRYSSASLSVIDFGAASIGAEPEFR